MRRAISTIALLATLVLAGCGGGSDEPEEASVPGGADAADVEVIESWSDALRSGDVEKAADYFELPSLAENGTPPLELDTREKVLAFNESLPCGAELVRASSEGDVTTATFELTERPGPGRCGSGTGERASTAFVIEDGKIAEWRRAPAEQSAPESRVV